eukprot:gnl/Dysnectes_brevis/7155_a11721_436.p1 GENE.gnl/Dysnectes_brevis/7155_a11721_436~~gnl/Dysnectes_brevis/7155_a11721_436.p1  ORF type:complete len:284 (+),score=56.05 gnl/Dysnectes_brevis/7155_a11721_436:60-911(+)
MAQFNKKLFILPEDFTGHMQIHKYPQPTTRAFRLCGVDVSKTPPQFYEIRNHVPQPQLTALVDDFMSPIAGMKMFTPMDPFYFLLPYLSQAADTFREVDDILLRLKEIPVRGLTARDKLPFGEFYGSIVPLLPPLETLPCFRTTQIGGDTFYKYSWDVACCTIQLRVRALEHTLHTIRTTAQEDPEDVADGIEVVDPVVRRSLQLDALDVVMEYLDVVHQGMLCEAEGVKPQEVRPKPVFAVKPDYEKKALGRTRKKKNAIPAGTQKIDSFFSVKKRKTRVSK